MREAETIEPKTSASVESPTQSAQPQPDAGGKTSHRGGARRWVTVVGLMVGSVVATVGLLLVFDLYLHSKFDRTAGFNIHGYRGPVAGRKQPGEMRIVVLGGSTALGYGVRPEESFPAQLETMLNDRQRRDARSSRQFRVINLAWNNQGAYSFQWTLRDYASLNYDMAIFYEGYNDLDESPNLFVFRHDSPIFRLTGYMPITPIILKEKAMAIRYGGHLEDAYRGRKTVFKPSAVQRTTAAALESAVKISESLEHQLGRLSDTPRPTEVSGGGDCGARWAQYCGSIAEAATDVLAQGKRVIVVTQPYITNEHMDQQGHLAAMLHTRFGQQPLLKYVNLGKAIDVHDAALATDGMHLSAEGNRRIASSLAAAILPWVE